MSHRIEVRNKLILNSLPSPWHMEGLSNTVSVVLVISLWLFTVLVLFWERVENNLFCVCGGAMPVFRALSNHVRSGWSF